jgi:hypothetical protein
MSSQTMNRPVTARSFSGAASPAAARSASAHWQAASAAQPNLIEALMTTAVASYFTLIGMAMLLG